MFESVYIIVGCRNRAFGKRWQTDTTALRRSIECLWFDLIRFDLYEDKHILVGAQKRTCTMHIHIVLSITDKKKTKTGKRITCFKRFLYTMRVVRLNVSCVMNVRLRILILSVLWIFRSWFIKTNRKYNVYCLIVSIYAVKTYTDKHYVNYMC